MMDTHAGKPLVIHELLPAKNAPQMHYNHTAESLLTRTFAACTVYRILQQIAPIS